MNKSSRLLVSLSCAVGLLSLAGCSSKFTMPWEKDMLDPSRIATKEPLEIPPDLDVLPGNEPPEQQRAGAGGTGERDEAVPGSARSILFNTPQPRGEDRPLGRDEKEQLPGWLGKSQ